jgi:hypothetical protein
MNDKLRRKRRRWPDVKRSIALNILSIVIGFLTDSFEYSSWQQHRHRHHNRRRHQQQQQQFCSTPLITSPLFCIF